MMIIYVPAYLEGRFLSIMVSLKINPLLISPNLLAHPLLLALVALSVELILNFHILQMVHPEISPQMGSTLACSLKKPNPHLLLSHPYHF
jgi:hypothetical protein